MAAQQTRGGRSASMPGVAVETGELEVGAQLSKGGDDASGFILACGWLEKSRDGLIRAGWAKRYFVLTTKALYYFQRKEPRTQLFGEQHGCFPLAELGCFLTAEGQEGSADKGYTLITMEKKSERGGRNSAWPTLRTKDAQAALGWKKAVQDAWDDIKAGTAGASALNAAAQAATIQMPVESDMESPSAPATPTTVAASGGAGPDESLTLDGSVAAAQLATAQARSADLHASLIKAQATAAELEGNKWPTIFCIILSNILMMSVYHEYVSVGFAMVVFNGFVGRFFGHWKEWDSVVGKSISSLFGGSGASSEPPKAALKLPPAPLAPQSVKKSAKPARDGASSASGGEASSAGTKGDSSEHPEPVELREITDRRSVGCSTLPKHGTPGLALHSGTQNALNSWSPLDGSFFKIRSEGYKGKAKGQKEFSAGSLYDCIGCDWVRSTVKVRNIAGKVALPHAALKASAPWANPENIPSGHTGEKLLPALYCCVLNVPLVSPGLMSVSQAEKDDPGFSVTFWWAIKKETIEVSLLPGGKPPPPPPGFVLSSSSLPSLAFVSAAAAALLFPCYLSSPFLHLLIHFHHPPLHHRRC